MKIAADALTLSSLDYEVTSVPVSQNCAKIFQLKEHALIGISPFNSYYSEERITKLIHLGYSTFKDFHLFVPDTLPYFNFLAMGYAPDKAKNKTKRQWNYLKNKIVKGFSNNGFLFEAASKIVTIGETLKNNDAYNLLHQACLQKYKNDASFKKNCLDASKNILVSYTDSELDDKLETAVQYLLAELPLYLDTPSILKIKSSVFIYHEKLIFFEKLYRLRSNELLANNQGHLIINL